MRTKWKVERGRKRRKIKAQEGCLVSSRLMRTKVEGGRKRRAEEGRLVSRRLVRTG